MRFIPNVPLKWLKNSRFYGSIDRIFDVSLSKPQPRREAQMGKSLNGKELGKGISQRKDGLYQAHFVNRFGKRETIYAKTLNEIRHQLRTEQFIVQEGIEACVRNIQKEHPEFEKFSPHCFRHTFATRAIENGMQPKTLQKILGHGSLQMTMDLYCHVTDDTLFEAMRLMEKAM